METASVERGPAVRGQGARPTLPPRPAEPLGERARWPAYAAVAVVCALLGAAASWFVATALPTPPAAPPAGVSHAGPPILVAGDGEVEVDGGIVELRFLAAGRVNQALVEEGQAVKRDAPLMRLDDADAQSKVKQARLGLEAAAEHERQARRGPALLAEKRRTADAEVAVLDEALHAAESKFAAFEALAEIAPAQLAAARGEIATVRKKCDAARQQTKELDLADPDGAVRLAGLALRGAEQLLADAERYLKDHELRAPEDGVATSIGVRPGALAGPTAPVPAVEFFPNRRRIVRLDVEQDLAGRMEAGLPASIHSDNPEEALLAKGKVVRLAGYVGKRKSGVEFRLRNDARTMACYVEVEGDDRKFVVGTRVRVRVYRAAADVKP